MLDRAQLERWLFGAGPEQRRTQDSPILPDVWFEYALPRSQLVPRENQTLVSPEPGVPPPGAQPPGAASSADQPPSEVDLLLRPAAGSSSSELARVLNRRLPRPREDTMLAYNDAHVVCRLKFEELLQFALPLTRFWQSLWPGKRGPVKSLIGDRLQEVVAAFEPGSARVQGRKALHEADLPGDLIWLIGLVGRIVWERDHAPTPPTEVPTAREVVDAGLRFLGDVPLGEEPGPPMLWTVSRNRTVQTAISRSRLACKADAATQLFGLSCRDVRWAIIDSGIDARHPAFGRRNGREPITTTGEDPEQSGKSRIGGTWDFATIREKLVEMPLEDQGSPSATGELSLDDPRMDEAQRMATGIARGQAVDWEVIAPRLAIAHNDRYGWPADDHGTHVAGILAADWRAGDSPPPPDEDIQGMCPDMTIYDLRAFDQEGTSDEFRVLSAMQFVRHLNAHADIPILHGVNLSFSVVHDVDKYAAGATPVCEEAHRLIGSGVVVVAAAGNDGRGGYLVHGRELEGYRSVSITDPGNAEKVITVGATHRDRPHTYGVSYFSSKGPTGDGRAKPDVVAPGEKITSTVPGAGLRTKDGTSQATPHVSGACALLMARHPELIGQPERVKQILMATCTDLGRERYFQGAGMIDVLRAIQAV